MCGYRKTGSIKVKKENFKKGKLKYVIAGCIICVIVFALAIFAYLQQETVITLEAQPAEMIQGEALPEISVKVTLEGSKKRILDWKPKYTVNNLLTACEKGETYQAVFDTDGKMEGEFQVKIELTKEFQESLKSGLGEKVTIQTEDASLTVKNKYGQWEENKFQKYDGNYARKEFIESKGKTYYFDDSGNMVTGELKIGCKKYVFSEDGALLSEELCVDPGRPMIALTFDDGPGKDTGRLLDTLEQYDARATFFMVGPRVQEYPQDLQRMLDLGCELGNHTTNHPQLTKLSPEQILKEINTTTEAIKAATNGIGPDTVRPPYGAINDTVKRTVEYPLIMWSVDTLDWKTRNAQSTIDIVMNQASDGDIILMHDIHKESVDAAVQLIPALVNKGYQLVTVSELAQARGITLENGERYSQMYP